MTPRARLLPLLPLVLALTACSGAAPGGGASGSAAGPSTSASASGASTGTAVDVCTLVPTAELQAVMGVDPGTGVAAKGKVDGGQCTWTASTTHTALAQYSLQPDDYFPAPLYKAGAGDAAVAGATRGYASAAHHTILVVKDGRGLLFTDVVFGSKTGEQAQYDALANAIAARL